MRARPIVAALLVLTTGALTAPEPVPRPRPALATAVQTGEAITVEARQVDLDFPAVGLVTLRAALALSSRDRRFGGISAISVAEDGVEALLVSDRGHLFTARLEQRSGAVTGVRDVLVHDLVMPDGSAAPVDWQDAESLAVLPDGDFVIGFERVHRLWRYRAPGGLPVPVPPFDALEGLQFNSGIEALAADRDGRLYAIPERSGALERPFPVWRSIPGTRRWLEGRWPRRPPFLVTGADIGPDGRLYVLERDFGFWRGWSMRLSRAALSDWPDFRPETLLVLRGGGIDNMEGVSVRRDSGGALRALIVSDDNFHPLQRTLLLDLVLPD